MIDETATAAEAPPDGSPGSDPLGWAEDCIRQRPDLAVLGSVAAGLAVGVALSTLLDGVSKPAPASDNAFAALGRRLVQTFDEIGKTGVSGIRDKFTG